MNKKNLSETDIRSKFISPAIFGTNGAGWDLMTQVREEAYFTKGRVIVRGKTVRRGEAKKADYLKLLLEKQYDEMRSVSAVGAQPNLNVQKIKAVFVPLLTPRRTTPDHGQGGANDGLRGRVGDAARWLCR